MVEGNTGWFASKPPHEQKRILAEAGAHERFLGSRAGEGYLEEDTDDGEEEKSGEDPVESHS